MHVRKCQLCDSTQLEPIIDLGHHPLADTFLPTESLKEQATHYPLRVQLCRDCGYAMLAYIVPAEERYQKIDYSYTASNSPVAVAHFGEMAQDIGDALKLASTDLAIDVGSNDGTLLKAFRETYGCRVLGVEPAANIARLAEQNGIETINHFFAGPVIEKIQALGDAKTITATNVYNHITDLNQFMQDIADALTDDGMFVFEAPSLLELIRRKAFDTIYLEHVSYFGIKPLARFYQRFGLHIHQIQLNDYMGGSMRVYVGKHPADPNVVNDFVQQEEAERIYDPATYTAFMRDIRAFRADLCRQLYEIKQAGGVIVGIGAATKGNTLLNYCKIDGTLLECVTDGSPLKVGKHTPGSHLPILRDEDIPAHATHALILPWNIGTYLKDKLKHLNLEFIIPRMRE